MYLYTYSLVNHRPLATFFGEPDFIPLAGQRIPVGTVPDAKAALLAFSQDKFLGNGIRQQADKDGGTARC